MTVQSLAADSTISGTTRMLDADTRFWNKVARKYAADPIADEAGYEKSLSRTGSFLRWDFRVLEVGCGTGTTALRLASKTGHITATDLSSEMVTIAREKAAAQNVSNVSFGQSPVGDWFFDGEDFDAVMAFNILHLVPDLDAALVRLRASLKPGGLLITKTACLGDMNPLIRFAIPFMRLIGKAPGTVWCFTAGELRAAIERAGFEIVCDERHGTKGKDFRPYIVARKIERLLLTSPVSIRA
jgi:SAM-dependent methyltransferase